MTAYLGTPAVNSYIVPGAPQADLAVASNFERFDGIEQPPLENPAADFPDSGGSMGLGADYGQSPRPGQHNQPTGQTYTEGPLSGVVGVLGGQPLPVADAIHRPTGVTTLVNAPTIQFRQGVGQRGPSELGVAQTVTLSQLTNNPPEPGDLTSILAGWG